MSYSKTSRAVIRVQQVLDDLLFVDGPREWPSKDAHRLAYHIREALSASQRLPEFRKYAPLKEKFIIRAKNGAVLAEPRVRAVYEGMEFAIGKIKLDDVTTVEEVVGAITKHKIEEIHFPHFPTEPEDELTTLFRATEKLNLYIINHYVEGITVTRRNPGEMRWFPS